MEGEDADVFISLAAALKFAESLYVGVPVGECEIKIVTSTIWQIAETEEVEYDTLSIKSVKQIKEDITRWKRDLEKIAEDCEARFVIGSKIDVEGTECNEKQKSDFKINSDLIEGWSHALKVNKENRNNVKALSKPIEKVTKEELKFGGGTDIEVDDPKISLIDEGVTKIEWFGGPYSFTGGTTNVQSTSFSSFWNWGAYIDAEVSVEFETKFGEIEIENNVHIGASYNFNQEKSETEELSTETTVSFTLADDDFGDHYLTRVYRDPHYGTPIFLTEGGESRCWHANNTENRNKFKAIIEDASGASTDSAEWNNTSPNEGDYELINIVVTGESSDLSGSVDYILEVAENKLGLKVQTEGITISEGKAQKKSVPWNDPVVFPLLIERGAVKDEYHFDLKLNVYPFCEDGTIEFLKELTMKLNYGYSCPELQFKSNYPDEPDTIYINENTNPNDLLNIINLAADYEADLRWKEPNSCKYVLEYRTRPTANDLGYGEWKNDILFEPTGRMTDLAVQPFSWGFGDMADGAYEIKVWAYTGLCDGVTAVHWAV